MPSRRDDIDHKTGAQNAGTGAEEATQAPETPEATGASDVAADDGFDPYDPYNWMGRSDQDMPEVLTSGQEAAHALNSSGYNPRSFHLAGGGDSAQVDTQAIRDTAASGRELISQIRELIQTMSSYVAASDAYWKGSTGDDFREGFADGMMALAKDLEEHAEYVRELIAYADKHEGVITEANAIASSLEDVVWHDV